jgi:hypothetical protein
MTEIDKRNRLDDEIFTYQLTKDKKVFIFWKGKPVKILKGREAQAFTAKIINLDFKTAQLMMAKATGNFKRGNERHE